MTKKEQVLALLDARCPDSYLPFSTSDINFLREAVNAYVPLRLWTFLYQDGFGTWICSAFRAETSLEVQTQILTDGYRSALVVKLPG